MGQKEGLLTPTEISSSEYKLETESNVGSVLLAHQSPIPTPPPPPYTAMSQHNLYTIIRQQQEQLVAMQVQIQALIAGETEAERGATVSNREYQMEVAKLLVLMKKQEKWEDSSQYADYI